MKLAIVSMLALSLFSSQANADDVDAIRNKCNAGAFEKEFYVEFTISLLLPSLVERQSVRLTRTQLLVLALSLPNEHAIGRSFGGYSCHE